jgi:Ca-activated chloride channel family protein
LATVAEAFRDLDNVEGRRAVVILTAGEDECDGSADAVAEGLAAGIELRVVTLGVPAAVAEGFGAVVPTRNPGTVESISAALAWVIEGFEIPPPEPVRVIAEMGNFTAVQAARLVGTNEEEPVELELSNEAIGGTVPPGVYSFVVEDGISGTVEAHSLWVLPGQDTTTTFDFSPRAVMAIEAVPQQPVAGSEVAVSVVGAPPGDHWVALAPAGQPAAAWIERIQVSGPDDHVFMTVPDWPGEFEIRFHERLAAGLSRIGSSFTIWTREPEVSLAAPDLAGRFEIIEVDWSGPDNPGDRLVIAWPASPAARFGACRATDSGNPAVLGVPGEPGMWELRYLTGRSGTILARAPIEVTEFIVSLEAPESVAMGEIFEVQWAGPAENTDFISIAAKESAGDTYLGLHLAELGSPARLAAPTETGTYEVRYVSGSGNRVLRRADIVVQAAPVHLEAPAAVIAGDRFQVLWTGPNLAGDYISIARPSSGPRQHVDFSYTSAGNPASLAAPFRRGYFEIRYVSGATGEILTAVRVRVEE